MINITCIAPCIEPLWTRALWGNAIIPEPKPNPVNTPKRPEEVMRHIERHPVVVCFSGGDNLWVLTEFDILGEVREALERSGISTGHLVGKL